jgi:hypothetical protein
MGALLEVQVLPQADHSERSDLRERKRKRSLQAASSWAVIRVKAESTVVLTHDLVHLGCWAHCRVARHKAGPEPKVVLRCLTTITTSATPATRSPTRKSLIEKA